jgi:chromosome segregation ATPase
MNESYVDPTSKYYIDRMWEEYHKVKEDLAAVRIEASSAWQEYRKMKEELADTKSKLGQSENYISETLKPELEDAKIKLKMAHSAWDELDKSHASRAKLHDELIIAEGQRDQAKMRAEAAQAALVSAQMEAEAEHRACERVIAERDALLKVYEAAKVWAEVTDPPRTDNYREFREATINLLDAVALVFAQRGPNFTYATRPSHIPVETWEDTRARCS